MIKSIRKIIGQKQFKEPSLDKMNPFEICSDYDHCDGFVEQKEDGSYFLNPSNQTCFNMGRFTAQDFRDWAVGTGDIVKGKTSEDKKKVMEYAILENEYPFMIFLMYKHLDKLTNGNDLALDGTFTNRKKLIDLNQTKEEIISQMYSWHIPTMVYDYENTVHTEVYDGSDKPFISAMNKMSGSWNEFFWGISSTLNLMGYGYSGASNTPEDINNLAWVSGLVKAKVFHEYAKKYDLQLPDFEFVESLRFK